ncbi:MAG TPA: hypothetical protein VN253_21550 [Kofleriaceae bacterium]|nr:hypothetical protein [Kofleriaceae bacterium]
MRAGFALILVAVLGACGGDAGGGGDDGVTPDTAGIKPPGRGFQLQSPNIDIQPGQEITYCWYFRTPNTVPMAITRWSSSMTPGSHHMIMYTSKTDIKPVGSVSAADCGALAGGAGNFPVWTYSAQTPEDNLQLPTDDGTGKPLAVEVAANQAGFIQMHYLNASDTPIQVHVTVTGDALDEGAAYTRTAAYVTYNGNINIPALTSNYTQSMSCTVPATSKFWRMSTHAHKQATHTAVKDGPAMVFESINWERPGAASWTDATPFYTFASGKLTYECTWNNPTTHPIKTGDSAQTDEMCMASGYFFPATQPAFCYNNVML